MVLSQRAKGGLFKRCRRIGLEKERKERWSRMGVEFGGRMRMETEAQCSRRPAGGQHVSGQQVLVNKGRWLSRGEALRSLRYRQ